MPTKGVGATDMRYLRLTDEETTKVVEALQSLENACKNAIPSFQDNKKVLRTLDGSIMMSRAIRQKIVKH